MNRIKLDVNRVKLEMNRSTLEGNRVSSKWIHSFEVNWSKFEVNRVKFELKRVRFEVNWVKSTPKNATNIERTCYVFSQKSKPIKLNANSSFNETVKNPNLWPRPIYNSLQCTPTDTWLDFLCSPRRPPTPESPSDWLNPSICPWVLVFESNCFGQFRQI